MLFNIVIPIVSVDANKCNAAINPLPQLSLFSALKAPFDQISKFVNEENPLASRFTASQNKKNDDGANSSSDYFFPNQSRDSKSIERDASSQKLEGLVKVDFDRSTFPAILHYRNIVLPGEANFAYLILLAYLVLLAMSNLPWILGILRRAAIAQLGNSSWVFHL